MLKAAYGVGSPETPGETGVPDFDRDRELLHRRMLSSVSHDLKTPLASVIGSLEVLERMKNVLPPEKQEMLLEVALQEAYRLDNFITNILDMAKLESNLVKPRLESVDIGNVIRNCLLRMENRLQDCTVTVDAPAIMLEVITDPILLCRALALVIDNAAKYGDRPAAIHIICGSSSGTAFISVRDNGRGIPAGQMTEIFSKYTRFAKSDQQTGIGLGLPIARSSMKLLEGEVEAANHADGGALFTLKFPLEAAAS